MSFLRFGTILLIALSLVACSSQTDTGASGQQVIHNDPNNTGLVARVNGVGITQEEYDAALARRSVNSNAADESALGQQVLNELIEQELINQGAPSLGVVITDADVEAEIAAQREIAGSDEAWNQFLAQNSYSEEDFFEAQRDVLITLNVRNTLLEPYLDTVEQVQARHILVHTVAEANEVLDRLEAGEGFATLAAEYSLDVTTAEIGGNLGWFARNELYYSNLEAVAFDLELNSITGPIATSLGYHVIQTLDRAVREIEPERLPVLSENIFNSWLNEQYRNAAIEVYLQWQQ